MLQAEQNWLSVNLKLATVHCCLGLSSGFCCLVGMIWARRLCTHVQYWIRLSKHG